MAEQEFAKIGRPWWKNYRLMFFIVSTILMFFFKNRVGAVNLSSAIFLWIVGNAIVFLGVSMWEEFKYKSHQVITTNLHGSYNPEAVHECGDYTMMTLGSFVHDVGAPRSGDYTVIVPKSLVADWGNNKIILGTPTAARIEELPVEVREFVLSTPYYKPPYLYTEVPANPAEKEVMLEGGTPIDTSRLTAFIKAHNATITTLHRLLGALERGAVSITDFVTSAKRMIERPSLLERVIGREKEEKKHAD